MNLLNIKFDCFIIFYVYILWLSRYQLIQGLKHATLDNPISVVFI